MKIGYQGIPGSYSEATLQDYLKRRNVVDQDKIDIIQYDNFNDLVDDVATESLDYIVLPIENSTTGLVTRAIDLLRYQDVVAIGEQYQSVNHILWGIAGAKIQNITQVYSHPEALSQCRQFFSSHPLIQPAVYDDTANAARFVAEQKDPHLGAIASERAGQLYGLEALDNNIIDEQGNTTRFLIIKKQKQDVNLMTGNHLYLYIETLHEPGSLSKLLQVFDTFHCNLEALNARPIKNHPFQYGFFIEVDLSGITSTFGELKMCLEEHSEYIKLIGRFERANAMISTSVETEGEKI